MSKLVEIDFEFNSTAEPNLNLVCCSLRIWDNGEANQPEEFWLYEGAETEALKKRILSLKDYTFIAHQVSSEAKSLLALDLAPLNFEWICTFTEYRCLTNHNGRLRYGKHLIKGKEVTIRQPKWSSSKEGTQGLNHSLSEMVYKLLNIKIDTDHKDEMRDIIISNDREKILANRKAIQEYCTSDIKYLVPCLKIMKKEFKHLLRDYPEFYAKVPQEMRWRGETLVRVAIIEQYGYPINYEYTKNFSANTMEILKDCQRDINSQFPDMGIYKYDKNSGFYSKKEKPLREWIDSTKHKKKWTLTKSGKYSLALDAFTDFYNYSHSYPRDNVGAQQVRFLKLKQSLNGFTVAKGDKGGVAKFWDSVGSDKRVRPYLNPYRSQSGRYQPKATGFLFLKPAWMRSLCEPPIGKGIAGIDYKSQEYLISALLSGDEKMINAYRSGDVYLSYGIDTGIAPEGATKKTHKRERDLSKPVVLGISYDQTEVGLSKELTEKTGKPVSENKAKRFIDNFYRVYRKFAKYKDGLIRDYRKTKFVRIPDGWYMWGDNPNFRSSGNCTPQGYGGAILRKAIQLCQDEGLKVIIPLHDALYIEYDLDNKEEALDTFAEKMREAFDFFFPNSGVLLDCETWSRQLEEGVYETRNGHKFIQEKIHIDDRSNGEYDQFKHYFLDSGTELL